MEVAQPSEREQLLERVLIEARIGVAARLDHWSGMAPGVNDLSNQRCVMANLEWVLGGLLDVAPGREKALLARVRTFKLVEVRCCCTPQKLLGWFELPRDQELQEYQRVRLVKEDKTGYLELQLRRWDTYEDHVDLDAPYGISRHIAGGIAFYSEDTPLQELRQVACFLENRSAW